MTEAQLDLITRQRQSSLARWDNEGGAGPDGPQKHDPTADGSNDGIDQCHAEITHLHVRMIALEYLLIALLAHVPREQGELAQASAASMSRRPEAEPQAATIHAAHEMLSMIERAEQLRMETAKHRHARSPGP